MRKILSILFFMVIGILLGCPTEELECTDSNNFVSLNVLTTDNVDSIHFFLNKKQVCHSNIGVFHNILICEDSSAKGYLSAIMADDAPDECDTPNKKLIWKGFHCFIGNSSDHVDIDSSILSLEIFFLSRQFNDKHFSSHPGWATHQYNSRNGYHKMVWV